MSTCLIAPGSTVTSAAAIVVAILNVVESTIRTEPPAKGVCGTLENENEYGREAVPCGLDGATALSAGGAIGASSDSHTLLLSLSETTYR